MAIQRWVRSDQTVSVLASARRCCTADASAWVVGCSCRQLSGCIGFGEPQDMLFTRRGPWGAPQPRCAPAGRKTGDRVTADTRQARRCRVQGSTDPARQVLYSSGSTGKHSSGKRGSGKHSRQAGKTHSGAQVLHVAALGHLALHAGGAGLNLQGQQAGRGRL